MKQLLLYLSHDEDVQRFAVGPTLAAAAERAGWEFECYYARRRLGQHFGGGPGGDDPARAAGSLVSGGRHSDQLVWLAARLRDVRVGAADSPRGAAPAAVGAERLSGSLQPGDICAAACERLGEQLPRQGMLLDASPH